MSATASCGHWPQRMQSIYRTVLSRSCQIANHPIRDTETMRHPTNGPIRADFEGQPKYDDGDWTGWLGWEDSNSGIRAQAMYLKRRDNSRRPSQSSPC